MKKIILISSIIICYIINLSAQYVTIPDANFRGFLKTKYPTCFNSQNQLDTTCTEIVNETRMNVSQKNILNIYGVQFFDSLKTLDCSWNVYLNFNSLPSLPKKLVEFNCSLISAAIQLPSLPNTLKVLNCVQSGLNSLPSLPQSLEEVNCSNNYLNSIPALPSSLKMLNCSKNQLTVLPELPSLLLSLDCRDNQLTSIPSLPSQLRTVYCQNNTIKILPTLPDLIEFLNCGANSELKCLPNLPNTMTSLVLTNFGINCLPNKPQFLKVYAFTDDNSPQFLLPDYPLCENGSSSSSCTITSIDGNVSEDEKFKVYPVPSSGYLNLTHNYQKGQSVTVFNSTGFLKESIPVIESRIDISDLKPGVYFIELNAKTGNYNQKFIVE